MSLPRLTPNLEPKSPRTSSNHKPRSPKRKERSRNHTEQIKNISKSIRRYQDSLVPYPTTRNNQMRKEQREGQRNGGGSRMLYIPQAVLRRRRLASAFDNPREGAASKAGQELIGPWIPNRQMAESSGGRISAVAVVRRLRLVPAARRRSHSADEDMHAAATSRVQRGEATAAPAIATRSQTKVR